MRTYAHGDSKTVIVWFQPAADPEMNECLDRKKEKK